MRAIWTEAARYSTKPLLEAGLQKIGRLLDDAHVRGLVTWASLSEMVDDISERGRSGSVIMRALADDRLPGTSPTESRNEDRLEEILASANVRSLRRQTPIGGHEPIGRSDFSDRDLPLIVEVNSLTYHSSPSDRAADEIRYRRFNEAGFTVAVIWENDLWSRPHRVVDTIVEARRCACASDWVVLHSPACPWPAPTRVPGTRICA